MSKIEVKDVIEAIRVCAEMEHAWYNSRSPSRSFCKSVKDMRRLLESLLELKDFEKSKEG